MCGISAICGPAQGETLGKMLDAISHRGVDERGEYTAHNISFGIQRLSIVGVAHGSQPLVDPVSRISLVCNGEIYNHEALRADLGLPDASGRADVDVVLHLYARFGSKALPRLDGMFALVIYDESRERFLAARDRYGIKPLYYIRSGKIWYFASEIKALKVVGQDERMIREVPPGHFVTNDGIESYHSKPKLPTSEPQPALLRALLRSSVEKQLQADTGVRFGIFLSGGLDSSIIAALASEYRSDLIAFTVGMKNSPDVEAARLVAAHFGIRLVSCIVDLDDLESQVAEAVWVTESYNVLVVFEGLLTMKLAEAAAAEGVKVVLSGEGADELFAGYDCLRALDAVALQKTRELMLTHIGSTECKRLDRATSAYSVEARVPFLDHGLVDWAMRLPVSCLIHRGIDQITEKWILREAFRELLPESIVMRAKIPMDYGSGILSLVDHISAKVPDTAYESYRKQFPDARIVDKITSALHMHWRRMFGEAGGTETYKMFCKYPVLQPVPSDTSPRDGHL